MATPKPARDPATGEVSEPKRGLPTRESLLARGWTELKPSGKGYGLPAATAKPRPGEEPAEAPSLDDDHVVALLRAAGQPVTRENWIDLAYGVDVPVPWTPEDELGLPEALQDWSKVVLVD